MSAALARHDRVIESLVAQHGGRVVRPRGEGDSRFAVFGRPSDAISAACAIQVALTREQWALAEPLRVRMAIHTGEGELRTGDYYGPAVNHCARLRAAAHGGQVLVSTVTADLVREALVSDVELSDLGEYQLKDLERPEHIWQLEHPDLQTDFPPLTVGSPRNHNLQHQLSSFVGRKDAIAKLRGLLVHARLITLVGPGGIGKTRLALEAVRSNAEIVFVDLAPHSDGGELPAVVAAALDIHEQPRLSFLDLLIANLAPRSILLILDNCEQIVAATSELVDQLLWSCPQLRILATSREPLAVHGEQVWMVQPLSVGTSAGSPASGEAEQLFAERARLVQPDFTLDAPNARGVTEICRHLDGIPLAIELAAARVRVLGVQGIAAHLDERLWRLRTESRGVPGRQRTLGSAIQWSYDLLTQPEQAFFRCLAVFVGGWTLDAAEAIWACTDRGSDTLDLLARLVDKSLVQAEPVSDGSVRYRFLDTIREFAQDRLRATDKMPAACQRHAAYFLRLLQEVESKLWGAEAEVRVKELEPELENLRTAFEWLIDSGDGQDAITLGAALERFWLLGGRYTEGQQWIARLLKLRRAEDQTLVRAKLLRAQARLFDFQGDPAAAQPVAEEALALTQQHGLEIEIARSLLVLATTVQTRGDFAEARRLLEEATRVSRDAEAHIELVDALHYLGGDALAAGDFVRAHAIADECLASARETGYALGVARAEWVLGSIAYFEHDLHAARLHLVASMDASHELNATRQFLKAAVWLGHVAADEEDYPGCASLLSQIKDLGQQLGDSEVSCLFLEGTVHCAAVSHQPQLALRLAAAAEVYREAISAVLFPVMASLLDQWLAPARKELGPERAGSLWETGRSLSMREALAEASGWVCAQIQ
jgi:predicted ATPase